MKLIFLLLALLIIFVGLSHTSTNYSPLDNYCKGVVKNYEDSIRHSNEVSKWLKYHQINLHHEH
jgi:hypothetical protein